jgi:hypothetical protein
MKNSAMLLHFLYTTACKHPFLKKICKFHGIEVLYIDNLLEKNYSSLIFAHVRLRLEPCIANLIWKSLPKVMKIPKYRSI